MNRLMPPRVLAILVAVVVLVTSVGSGTIAARAAAVDPELAEKLQVRLERWRVNHRAPGVAAAVRLPDGGLWIGTSGTRTVGKNAYTVKAGTPFAVASLTKTFIAALILELRDEGHFKLRTPLSTWLPNYPDAANITVKQLLNHRSGLFDYFDHPKYEAKVFGRPRHRWTVGEILRLRGPRYCRPGACFRYSNTNYVLLGRIIYRVTGRTAAWNIRRRFLEPLGLTDTSFQGQEPIIKTPAKGYWARPGGYRGFADGSRFRPNTSGATVANTAGAMVASVRDISDWQDALLGGEVLNPWSLRQMTTLGAKSGYGLGMRRAWLDGRPGIGHGGSIRGFVSIMYRLPEEDLDVTILTNLGRTSLQSLANNLTKATLRHLELQEPPAP